MGNWPFQWIPYSGGRKKLWAFAISGVYTWVPWVVNEIAKVTAARFSFLAALVYFLVLGVILWGVFIVGDWLRHWVGRA